MIRRITTCDQETSNGCGLRAKPCCGGIGLSVKTAENPREKEILPGAATISMDEQIQR